MRTFVATKNAGKFRELREIFAGSPLEIETYRAYADVEEHANSYIGNAMLKARALHEQLQQARIEAAVLADDSGIEVDALSARPGVLSARYGGTDIMWPQRRERLLGELRNVAEERRGAQFVCAMVLILPDGDELVATGTVAGRIVDSSRGTGGFGYDPVFLYPPCGRTFAELSEQEKNAVSHRRNAASALLAALKERV